MDHETIQQYSAEGRLIDVRTRSEFIGCHIKGAKNLPLTEFKKELPRLIRLKGPLLITCQSGQRAATARELLVGGGAAAGEVLLVEGGTDRWHKSGGEVVLGKKAVSIERQVRITAGAMVAIGSALTLLLNTGFVWLPLLVGSGLLIAGLTDSCLMGEVLSRMPWNRVEDGDHKAVILELEGMCNSSA